MNVKGKILEISTTQKISDKFQKRDFVLEYVENPQYPEFLQFEMIQDKCAQLDQFSAGDEVNVYFNLKGRKWTNPQGQVKYFNSLQAWRLEKDVEGMPPAPGMDNMEEPEWINNESNGEEDLPF
ncbi:DUF3127 domain-containing protein [Fulvivirga sedimenti]|uniref:DUF3127 domain-containing protein n=1 Tax=Fulvivirga sedimenti TaxID=2879465 RepID=A0A9X1KY94_9BACT|nr:DUF3127 domain-containing protein [Fulvivirga sedimenti]MCA6075413.1 DUF3127 domain-containing protein [Fulvivirga sedimenti]MCA6076590.1 DUF3127 domain-containing protein [Fulvivirga sedimenti]MCA6077718.1 DUF3127 domain-containing protein [Fulvivirga sedimenti]